jgi:hypothetical protein
VSDPYSKLVTLAERELELVRSGELEEVGRLHADRAELVATLPAAPPPEALPLLEAAAALQARIEATLQRDIAQAASELQSIRRGRHAVQAYTPGSAGESRLVDSTG